MSTLIRSAITKMSPNECLSCGELGLRVQRNQAQVSLTSHVINTTKIYKCKCVNCGAEFYIEWINGSNAVYTPYPTTKKMLKEKLDRILAK